jgi:hypothetical protein
MPAMTTLDPWMRINHRPDLITAEEIDKQAVNLLRSPRSQI